MNRLREFFILTGLNIRTWRSRPVASIVAVIGFVLVVLVFAAIFSIQSGFRATLGTTGARDVAMVLGQGAQNEAASSIEQSKLHLIASAPGVATGAEGPLAAPDVLTIVNLDKRSNGAPTNVLVRGVGPAMFRIQPQVKIIAGRLFKPGLNEIIVGSRAARQYKNLQLGSTVRLLQTSWKVVGIFSSDGDIHESEIWTGWHVLQSAEHVTGNISGVYVKLRSASAFSTFKAALSSNPQLDVLVFRESQYFAQQAGELSRFITAVGGLIAFLMGIGAVVGAINILYSMVSARARDIGTLRAVGFNRPVVAGSILVEGLLLGLIGGVIGEGIAYALFNGFEASTLSGFSSVVFRFSVTPSLLATGIGFALLMGFIGGLFPAIRVARLPITKALRET